MGDSEAAALLLLGRLKRRRRKCPVAEEGWRGPSGEMARVFVFERGRELDFEILGALNTNVFILSQLLWAPT